MTEADVATFAESIRGVLGRSWTGAGNGRLDQVWDLARTQGWFELGPAGALAAAVAAVRECGRVGCPLPVMDGYVAHLLGVPDVPGSDERSERRSERRAERAPASRILLARGDGTDTVRYAEAGDSATHVFTVPPAGGSGLLRPIRVARPTPGMAVPPWFELTLGPPLSTVDVNADVADEAVVLIRLGLAARALAAAERAHELAVEHAKVRHQFGRAVGSFGAVADRIAWCQIELTAGNLLIADAVRRYESGTGDWRLAAEIATGHARRAAPRVQLGAHHTLAATGYFEEHEAPWLFRRVHADVTRLAEFRRVSGELADVLVETAGSLPALSTEDEIRAGLRRLLDSLELAERNPGAPDLSAPDLSAPDLSAPGVSAHGVSAHGVGGAGVGGAGVGGAGVGGAGVGGADVGRSGVGGAGVGGADVRGGDVGGRGGDALDDDPRLVRALAEGGYLALGGAGQAVAQEEIGYRRLRANAALAAVTMLGRPIQRHGTPEQRARFLPLIRDGQLRFCLGYSEPEAGSDLARLRTRARRDPDGDGWIIDGQKLWTTGAHLANYVWLATRTDPRADPPHAGITVFLVPMDTPGITVVRHRALSGEISCTVTYQGVRVPDSARVGAVDGGWRVITDALAGERVVMGGIAAALHRQLDDLLGLARADPDGVLGPRGSAARDRLAGLAVRVQATRALVRAAAEAMAAEETPVAVGTAETGTTGARTAETGSAGAGTAGAGSAGTAAVRLAAPMAGVLAGEVAEDFGEAALEILGPAAALSGAFEYGLRLSIMYVVGGGTNDVQRGLIARGLGLPRQA